jgi:hypothetical protein
MSVSSQRPVRVVFIWIPENDKVMGLLTIGSPVGFITSELKFLAVPPEAALFPDLLPQAIQSKPAIHARAITPGGYLFFMVCIFKNPPN